MQSPGFPDVEPVKGWRTAVFSCRHVQVFKSSEPPAVGRNRWCKQCATFRLVVRLSTSWAVSCQGCRYARFCRWDEAEARRLAARHKGQRLTHAVTVWRDGVAIKVHGNSGESLLPLGLNGLDNDGTEIPF